MLYEQGKQGNYSAGAVPVRKKRRAGDEKYKQCIHTMATATDCATLTKAEGPNVSWSAAIVAGSCREHTRSRLPHRCMSDHVTLTVAMNDDWR